MYDLFFDSNLLTLSSRQKREFLYNPCDTRETKFTFTDNIYLLVIPAL